MKSKMKKVVSLVLAMAMVFTMSVTAFAEEAEEAEGAEEAGTTETTYAITINNSETGHTYEAYQIFTGDLSDTTLSNIEWGSGIDTTKEVSNKTLIQAIQAIADGESYPFASCSTAEEVADVLEKYNNSNSSDVAEAFADVVSGYLSSTCTSTNVFIAASGTEDESDYVAAHYSITGLTAGYYLVKDQDGSLSGEDKAYTDYILQVLGNETINAKSSSPTVTKKVKETNDSVAVADSTTDWQDAADYDIGDKIPYQLTGTMPSTLDDYTVYKYVFTDTLSKGLTVLKADGTTEATSSNIATTDVTVTVVTGDISTEVNTDDYSVTLTDYTSDDADTESTYTGGHVLTVSFDDVLTLTDENGNLISVTSASEIVVTYNAKLNDSAVIGSAGNPNEVYLTYSNNPNNKTGSETGETPEDKVTVFTFVLEVNKVDADGKALSGAGFTLYKKNSSGEYVAVGGEVTGTGDSSSVFTFSGLDSGLYMIKESKTPEGYNTADELYFEIAATYQGNENATDPKLSTLVVKDKDGETLSTGDGNATFTAVVDTGTVSTNVVNKKGSVLPSTGGIGTTIFYIVGAILVLGAGVVLVTRRRTAR